MDVEKAKALICTIQEKSISAAADKMGYTPSGVSRMIAALEDELGFQLLIRKKEGISITAECRQMLPAIQNYIRGDDECLQMAARIRGMEVGRITIGTAYSEYYRWLSRCIKDFHEKYPGIHMELCSGYSSDLVNRVLNHSLDLAIVSHRNAVDQWIPLRKDPLVAWVPKEHRLAKLDAVPIEEFARENYIDSNSEYETDNALLLSKYGIVPNMQIQSRDSYASWQMVEAGLGIGLNNFSSSRERTGDVKILPLSPNQTVEIGITYSRQMTVAGRIFIKHLHSDYISILEQE